MKIAVVKTADGPIYFSTARDAGRMAAVRMLLDQLRHHPYDVCDLSGGEALDAINKINRAGDPYAAAVAAGYIAESPVREN